MKTKIKQNIFKNIIDCFSGTANKQLLENAVLQAILENSDDDYCCLINNKCEFISEGFKKFINKETLSNIEELSNYVSFEDKSKIITIKEQIQSKGKAFPIKIKNIKGNQIFRLTISKDENTNSIIFWLKNITKEETSKRKTESLISKSKEEITRLEAALNKLPAPIWIRNSSSELIWVNDVYNDAVSTNFEETLKNQKELPISGSKKKSQKSIKEMAKEAWETNKIIIDKKHMISEGKRKLFSIREIPIKELNITLGLARDITREEDLESDLNRYAAANKGMLEQLRTAIAIFDSFHKIEFYNTAFEQLWNLEGQWLNTHPKLGEIMEKLRESRRLPEQADFRSFKKSWLDMFTTLIGTHEEMLYLPDGSALRMLVVPHSMGGLIMTFEDVTSRLELESSYNTLVAVQKETIDNLAEGVAVFGSDGRLKLWNPAFAKLWILNPEDLDCEPHITNLADKIASSYPKESQEKIKDNIKAQALNRNEESGRMEGRNNKLIDYSTVSLPDGGVMVTHIDVTDSVKVENALRDKNAALEAAERLKLDFLANVSYQLRTPLNTIMGFSEILSNEYFGSLNEKQKEYSQGIEDAGKRLLYLIDDILDLSTIEAGYLELNFDDMDIYKTLSSVHELTIDWARKEKIEISLNCKKDIGKISADEQRIKQIIINLIRNAIVHTPENGKIEIGATKDSNKLHIYVYNDGKSIDEKDQQKIFEPFERSSDQEAINTQNKGAGLGLTLVKNITELHGGRVTLESSEGQGTTFTINLPIKQNKA